jgi:hypothetical protein
MSGLKELVFSAAGCWEGDTVKLRGRPPDSRTPSGSPKGARGRGNDPGYGNSIERRLPVEQHDRGEVGHPQPSPTAAFAGSMSSERTPKDAVHRLHGGGFSPRKGKPKI